MLAAAKVVEAGLGCAANAAAESVRTGAPWDVIAPLVQLQGCEVRKGQRCF